jgi:hypothetical protein
MSAIRAGYTRISEILGRLKDRSGINQQVLMDKANIGTEVHHNIHMDYLGVPAHFGMHSVRRPFDGHLLREECRGEGYYNSYLAWKGDRDIAYKLMEERFYCNDLMITGQIDALLVTDKGLHLIDFKCSYAPENEIWPMQAHFYYYLLQVNGIEIEPVFSFMQLKKDGKKPTLYEYALDKNILSRCIEEAIKYQEEKNLALMLD